MGHVLKNNVNCQSNKSDLGNKSKFSIKACSVKIALETLIRGASDQYFLRGRILSPASGFVRH